MKYTQSLKGLTFTPKEEELVKRQISAFDKKLTNFVPDIPEFSLIIKKHAKNHFFSATMTFTLPKKKLIAETGGHEVVVILHEGFDKLSKAFEAYKAKHFKGSSKHPSHATVEDKKLDI